MVSIRMMVMWYLLVVNNLVGQLSSWPIEPEYDERQETSSASIADEANRQTNTTAKEGLDSGHNHDEDDDEDQVCVICHDDFLEEPRAEVDCGHCYHLHCLFDYKRVNVDLDTCFMCKKKLKFKDGKDFAELCVDYEQRKYNEEKLETAANKIKLGLLAGVKELPTSWSYPPGRFYGPDIYFAQAGVDTFERDDYA